MTSPKPTRIYTLRKMSTGNSEFTADFFDQSSAAWMANKKRKGQSIVYICTGIYKNGKKCNNAVVSSEDFCKVHLTKPNKRELKTNKE